MDVNVGRWTQLCLCVTKTVIHRMINHEIHERRDDEEETRNKNGAIASKRFCFHSFIHRIGSPVFSDYAEMTKRL